MEHPAILKCDVSGGDTRYLQVLGHPWLIGYSADAITLAINDAGLPLVNSPGPEYAKIYELIGRSSFSYGVKSSDHDMWKIYIHIGLLQRVLPKLGLPSCMAAAICEETEATTIKYLRKNITAENNNAYYKFLDERHDRFSDAYNLITS